MATRDGFYVGDGDVWPSDVQHTHKINRIDWRFAFGCGVVMGLALATILNVLMEVMTWP